MTLTLVLVGALPSHGSEFNPPVIESLATQGNAWVAYRIFAPEGSDWALNIPGGPYEARAWGGAVWYGRADENNFGWAAVTGWGYGRDRLFVSSAPTGVLADDGDPRVTEDGYEIGVGYGGSEEAEFTLAAVAVGSYRGEFLLRGSPGVKVLGRATGTQTAIFMDEDFNGSVHAHASVGLWVPFVTSGESVGVAAEASVATQISNRMFGWFRPGIGVSSWSGPPGVDQEEDLIVNGPPGRYDFTISATAIDNHQSLWFADVVVP